MSAGVYCPACDREHPPVRSEMPGLSLDERAALLTGWPVRLYDFPVDAIEVE